MPGAVGHFRGRCTQACVCSEQHGAQAAAAAGRSSSCLTAVRCTCHGNWCGGGRRASPGCRAAPAVHSQHAAEMCFQSFTAKASQLLCTPRGKHAHWDIVSTRPPPPPTRTPPPVLPPSLPSHPSLPPTPPSPPAYRRAGSRRAGSGWSGTGPTARAWTCTRREALQAGS